MTIGGSLEGVDVTVAVQPPPQVIAADVNVVFGGVGTKKSIKITNVYNKKIEIKDFYYPTGNFKHIQNNCNGEIDVNKFCEYELECDKLIPKDVAAHFISESKAPRALAATRLEGCSVT